MDFQTVIDDKDRKKAIYSLANMRIHGFASEHPTDGLVWFNTEERMNQNRFDLLLSATDVLILVKEGDEQNEL